jgi:hypothetical protein
MTFVASRVGNRGKRHHKSKRRDHKDCFDFHKFAFIRVQLSLTYNKTRLQTGAWLKDTTKD